MRNTRASAIAVASVVILGALHPVVRGQATVPPLAERLADHYSTKVFIDSLVGRTAALANRGRALQEAEIDRLSSLTDEPAMQRVARALVEFQGPVARDPNFKGMLSAYVDLALATLQRNLMLPGYAESTFKNASMMVTARMSLPEYQKTAEESEIKLNEAFSPEDAATVVQVTAMLVAQGAAVNELLNRLSAQLKDAIAKSPELLAACERQQPASEPVVKSRERVRTLIESARSKQ